MNEFSERSFYNLALYALTLMVFFVLQNLLVPGLVFGFSPEKAGFTVKFKDEVMQYKVIGVFVLPEEVLALEASDAAKGSHYVIRYSAGKLIDAAINKWYWQAPKETGLYPVKVVDPETQDSITLNVFVMIPYDDLKRESLNGYKIGTYPIIPFRQLPNYNPPKGFIEVTPENEEVYVAPHFKLKQFVCKQEHDYPKYVVLQERLLLMLELVLENMNKNGYDIEKFSILSGYRTPYYNHSIRNKKYSRHIYGDGADIFVDRDNDDIMDDLNSDGKLDYRDANILYDIIDSMYGEPWYERFMGGLARYRERRGHGPFVHVDTRGFLSRW
ncbi:MAG TPA: hypothetical protein VHT73_12600 [Thermodesulfobacteriota bacterium]|nr:hypothetical protein [Thermodesulfobacteriota bacterium]